MILFFTITLCLSSLGLLLLLSIKRYEMRTSRVLFARARPNISYVLHGIVLFVQHILPFIARRSIAKTFAFMRSSLSRALARLTLYVEVTLKRALTAIQQTMQPRRSGGSASTFLQEVAEHKSRLLKDPVEKRAIFEEYH